jgi:hypothetical protein
MAKIFTVRKLTEMAEMARYDAGRDIFEFE